MFMSALHPTVLIVKEIYSLKHVETSTNYSLHISTPPESANSGITHAADC